MSKTVAFKKPAPKPAEVELAQRWVEARETPKAVPANDVMKRFTIDVSEDLHKRIKMECAARGSKMADVIRDMLESAFPGK